MSNDRRNVDTGPDCSDIVVGVANYPNLYRRAMDWARENFSYAFLKDSTQRYCLDKEIDWTPFAAAPDWRFAIIGKMAWISNQGGELEESSIKWLRLQLEKIEKCSSTVDAADIEEEEPLTNRQISVRRYVNLYSTIDAIRVRFQEEPDVVEERVAELLSAKTYKVNLLKTLYKHFKEILVDTLQYKDDEYWIKTIEPLVRVVNVLAARTGNASASIGSKKLSRSVIKRADEMNTKSVDAEYGLVGVSAGLIVGSKMAVTFNTKTRKFSVFTASDDGVLDIKGQYITGFDEKASYAKTLKKPKELITHTNLSSIKRVNVVFGQYVNDKAHTVSGKMGKDVIIVKVFKN